MCSCLGFVYAPASRAYTQLKHKGSFKTLSHKSSHPSPHHEADTLMLPFSTMSAAAPRGRPLPPAAVPSGGRGLVVRCRPPDDDGGLWAACLAAEHQDKTSIDPSTKPSRSPHPFPTVEKNQDKDSGGSCHNTNTNTNINQRTFEQPSHTSTSKKNFIDP